MSVTETAPCFLRRTLSAIVGDSRGLALLELSILLPVLILLTCGTADVAFGFIRQLKLQQASARTAELATASGLITNLPTTLQAEAAGAASVPSSQVTVDMWLECDGVRQGDFNGTCSTASPARFTSVTVRDTYYSMFSSVFAQSGSTRLSIPLQGFSAVRIQ